MEGELGIVGVVEELLAENEKEGGSSLPSWNWEGTYNDDSSLTSPIFDEDSDSLLAHLPAILQMTFFVSYSLMS